MSKPSGPPQKSGASKLMRTEVVTVRFDPRTRYLLEIAARVEDRTVSSFIERAVRQALDRVVLAAKGRGGPGLKNLTSHDLHNEADYLWDVDEADRFAKLAIKFPSVLNHEERVRWKRIEECGYFWKGEFAGPDGEWVWDAEHLENLRPDRLREHWQTVCEVADGRRPASALPDWSRYRPSRGVTKE